MIKAETYEQAEKILTALAEQGICISVCYGHSRHIGRIVYSVDVFTIDGESFDNPMGAETYRQAIEIAYNECVDRGWAEHTLREDGHDV